MRLKEQDQCETETQSHTCCCVLYWKPSLTSCLLLRLFLMNICEGGNRWVLGSSATVRQQHQPLDLHTLGTGTQRCKVHRLLEILACRYILIKLFPVAAVQICDSMYRTHWTGRRAVPACRSLRGPRGSRASPPAALTSWLTGWREVGQVPGAPVPSDLLTR